jgi:hypothetical protein
MCASVLAYPNLLGKKGYVVVVVVVVVCVQVFTKQNIALYMFL